jgi:hypothetical protein
VLFSGTVRNNLDPFGEYSDDAVWQALTRCHMAGVVREGKAASSTPMLHPGGKALAKPGAKVGARQPVATLRASVVRRCGRVVPCVDVHQYQ